MKMRLVVGMVLLCCLAAFAAADTVTITLDLNANVLRPRAAVPSVADGDTLRIEIPTIDPAKQTKWHFTLGGNAFDNAALAGGIAYQKTVTAAMQDLTIRMLDDDRVVELSSDIRVPRRGAAPAAAPAAAVTSGDAASTALSSIIEPGYRRTYDRQNDILNLYFDVNGLQVHGDIPRDVDDNDVLRIFLVGTEAEVTALDVTVEGTFSVADEFNALGSGSLGDLAALAGKIQAAGLTAGETRIFRLGTFGPYAPPSITIKISKISGATKTLLRQYPVRINKTYLAAYRLMAGRSDIRFNEYEATTRAGQTGTFIENVSDEDGQNRYFLTLVPYAWQFWSKSNWRGRDIAEPPAWTDRFNPVIGVGLKSPGKEFLGGVSIEVARGVDVVWALHRAEVNVLAGGYKEGDAFTGASADIPTKTETETSHIVGVSLDLRVALQLLSSLF